MRDKGAELAELLAQEGASPERPWRCGCLLPGAESAVWGQHEGERRVPPRGLNMVGDSWATSGKQALVIQLDDGGELLAGVEAGYAIGEERLRAWLRGERTRRTNEALLEEMRTG
jgi:hypothetical protein